MKKGFTLIEILIVMTIIGILSAISFGAVKSGKKNLALLRSAQALATEIRRAQSMALAPKKIGENFPKSYGIYIEKTPLKIYLYADTSLPENKYTQNDEIINDFCQFEKDLCGGEVEIDYLSPNPNVLDIVFKPPHPTIIINQNGGNLEAEIRLKSNSQTKTIKIYKSGLISVK